MMIRKYYNYLFSIIPLLIGGIIYICFRNDNIIFFSWLRYLNINYSHFQQIYIEKNIISSYIIYSLPNGLWVLTGLFLLKIFLINSILKFYSIIFILLSIFIEIGQLFEIIPGTFDVLDLFTIFIFSGIGLAINIYKDKYEKI